MTPADEAVWKIVKHEPRTKAQWLALHHLIENYKQLLVDDWKRQQVKPPQETR